MMIIHARTNIYLFLPFSSLNMMITHSGSIINVSSNKRKGGNLKKPLPESTMKTALHWEWQESERKIEREPKNEELLWKNGGSVVTDGVCGGEELRLNETRQRARDIIAVVVGLGNGRKYEEWFGKVILGVGLQYCTIINSSKSYIDYWTLILFETLSCSLKYCFLRINS